MLIYGRWLLCDDDVVRPVIETETLAADGTWIKAEFLKESACMAILQPRFSVPRVVPREYAGLWIAWDHEGTRIVASGRTIDEAAEAAASVGESRPVFAKVPKADVRFVGLHQ